MILSAPAAAPRPYLPAIDGLRAVAVIAVILFHLDARLLPGGFVGVDVFFVLSGFLLAPIVTEAVAGGRGSVAHFYQRRIARIFPGSALVLAVTLGAGILLLEGRNAGVLAQDAEATALLAANIRFARMADYWRLADDARPLLHYWSLALEEQFYLLFPLLMFALARMTRHLARAIATLAVLGFFIGLALTLSLPKAAFYMLPARAWELLAGAAFALHGAGRLLLLARWRKATMWLGLVLIAGAMIACTRTTPFPGVAALFPVVGTLLILDGAGDASRRVVRLLAARAPLWIGQRSFALYLWHWPIFCFADYVLYAWPTWAIALFKLTLTVAASMAAYALVERPARRWLGAPHRRRIAFAMFFLGTVAILVAARLVGQTLMVDATPRSIAAGGVRFAGDRPGPVLLVGDSMASSYARQLALACNARGVTLEVVSISGAYELPGSPLWADVVALAARERPRTIIIAHNWIKWLKPRPAVLNDAVAALSPYTQRIILLPNIPFLPESATRHGQHAGGRPPFVEVTRYRLRREMAERWLAAATGGKVTSFPVARYFTARDGSVLANDSAGHSLYFNASHPSEAGAARVVGALAPLALQD